MKVIACDYRPNFALNFFFEKFMVYYNDSSPLIINPPFEFEKEDLF